MEALKVGIREFREKLASYLLESTCLCDHSSGIRWLLHSADINGRRRASSSQRSASRLQQVLASEGFRGRDSCRLQVWRAARRNDRAQGLVLDANICCVRSSGNGCDNSGSLRGPSQLLLTDVCFQDAEILPTFPARRFDVDLALSVLDQISLIVEPVDRSYTRTTKKSPGRVLLAT